MQQPPQLKNRTIFSTEDRLNKRGVRARAVSWGWSWVSVGAGGSAHYVSMGIPATVTAHGALKAERQLARARAKCDRNEAERRGVEEASRHYIEQVAKHNSDQFHSCPACGYAEASLIGDRREFCPACKGDDIAILGISILVNDGINLGWRLQDLERKRDFIYLTGHGFNQDNRLNRLKRTRTPCPICHRNGLLDEHGNFRCTWCCCVGYIRDGAFVQTGG